MYGNILASCSYDRKVIIWKEENGTWEKTHEHTGHDSSGTVRSEGEHGGPAGGSVLPGAPRLPPGPGLLFCQPVHSKGEVLSPKASTQHNQKSKDNIVRLVGWFFPLRFIHFKYWSLF